MARCVEGAACPECGCPDSVELRRGTWWNKTFVRRRCQHCGREFECSEEAVKGEAVSYGKTHCPDCESTNNVVTTTLLPVRYHRCNDCGCRFKSVED